MIFEKRKIIAGIEVGSNFLKMKIGQLDRQGDFFLLENLKKTLLIGRDTFNTGEVSIDTTKQLISHLEGFQHLLESYGIDTYRCVCTSGLREAKNRDFIIHQVAEATGIAIEVINSSTERFLTYKSIRDHIQNHRKLREKGCLIMDIGSGSLELSIYKDHRLQYSQSSNLGSLRIHETLQNLEGESINFSQILQEYIEGEFDDLNYPRGEFPPYFIVLGGDSKTLLEILPSTDEYIEKEVFDKTLRDLLVKDQLSIPSSSPSGKSLPSTIVPSILLLSMGLRLTQAEGVYLPQVTLTNGLLVDLVDQLFETPRRVDFSMDLDHLIRKTGEKFMVHASHSEQVQRLSLSIFDGLRKEFGLTDHHRFLLKTSAYLHDMGKFVQDEDHPEHSYYLFRHSQVLGLSDMDRDKIAQIMRYHHEGLPNLQKGFFRNFTSKESVELCQLIGILKIANSLDQSHLGKLPGLSVKVTEDKILLKGTYAGNLHLERWSFNRISHEASRAFGKKLEFIQKGRFAHEISHN